MIEMYQLHYAPLTSFALWACLIIVSMLEFIAVSAWTISRKTQDPEEVESQQLFAGIVLLFSPIFSSLGVIPWAVLQPMFLLVTLAEGGPW
jgi:hypothetical protein